MELRVPLPPAAGIQLHIILRSMGTWIVTLHQRERKFATGMKFQGATIVGPVISTPPPLNLIIHVFIRREKIPTVAATGCTILIKLDRTHPRHPYL
jgi:hypothetical protein